MSKSERQLVCEQHLEAIISYLKGCRIHAENSELPKGYLDDLTFLIDKAEERYWITVKCQYTE